MSNAEIIFFRTSLYRITKILKKTSSEGFSSVQEGEYLKFSLVLSNNLMCRTPPSVGVEHFGELWKPIDSWTVSQKKLVKLLNNFDLFEVRMVAN